MHDPRQEFTADEWHDWERALRDAEDADGYGELLASERRFVDDLWAAGRESGRDEERS